MLTKCQKTTMYLIGIFSMFLSALVIIPYRAFWTADNVYTIEWILKLIILPLVFITLSIYPNVLKYRQVASYREQSKVVSVISYVPYVSYLTGLLIYGFYILGKGVEPFLEIGLGMGAYSLWLAIILVAIVLLMVGIHFFSRYEMQLNVKEHIIFDVSLSVVLIFFAVLVGRISQIYRVYFKLYVPRQGSVGEIELFVIFLLFFIIFGIHCKKLYHFVQTDEINLVIKADKIKDLEMMERAEYRRAYREIIRKFKEQIHANVESKFAKVIQEEVEKETKEETIENSKNNDSEIASELVVDVKGSEEKPVKEAEPLPVTTPEVVEEVVEVVAPVDEEKVKELAIEREKIEEEKALLNQKHEELRLKQEEVDKKRQAALDLEASQKKEPVEDKKADEKVARVIVPSFKVVTNFAKSIPNVSYVENENNIRFMVGKKVFLIANDTKNDYRLTFMYDLKEIVELMIKYPTVVKAKTPKGPNWFKLVNKGEFKEEDLFSIVEKSHKTFLALENQNRKVTRKKSK